VPPDSRDEELEEFDEAVGLQRVTPAVTMPPPVIRETHAISAIAETDDSPEDLVTRREDEPRPDLPLSDNPAAALDALRQAFPNAPLIYLDRVANSSRYHIAAILYLTGYRRTRALITAFMDGGGETTTEILAPLRQNGGGGGTGDVRDTGLVYEQQGRRYTLSLTEFRFGRSPRSYLSSRDRKTVLSLFGAACTQCGAEEDLHMDHREGSCMVGDTRVQALGLAAWQALCRMCNNSKKTVCGRCQYGCRLDDSHCHDCAWAHPESHTHTAGVPGTRVTVILGPEAVGAANTAGVPPREWARRRLVIN
jgi:hypothetical protein